MCILRQKCIGNKAVDEEVVVINWGGGIPIARLKVELLQQPTGLGVLQGQ